MHINNNLNRIVNKMQILYRENAIQSG